MKTRHHTRTTPDREGAATPGPAAPSHYPQLLDSVQSVAVRKEGRLIATLTPSDHTLPARSCCETDCLTEIARTRFDDEHLDVEERRLAALADSTRLRIIHLLARHESLCVCEIESAFDLGQPTISHHLRVLREAGIVTAERRGTWAYYSLARSVVKALLADLLALA